MVTRAAVPPCRFVTSPADRSSTPGIGEKLTGLEAFHPERMASRILGMGDVLSLIEDAQKGIDEEKASSSPGSSSRARASISTTSRTRSARCARWAACRR
jgi:hypothetical protein